MRSVVGERRSLRLGLFATAFAYRSVIRLCGSLGVDVIAEGIESTAQADTVFTAGCRLTQGHLFGRAPSRPLTRLDKSDVLSGLFATWEGIDAVVGDLPDAQWSAATALPGWAVRDVVAHVIGTESMLQGVDMPEADLDVSTLGHVRNDIGVMNERWVRSLRGLSNAELLQRFRFTTAERRKALTDMGSDQWHDMTMTPAGPDSYGRFMRVRTFDCFMHENDIREAVDAGTADLSGPAARLALDEMETSMGFVVGKLGGAPDGSRVRLELTGPLARTIDVAVDGRAKVVDGFDGEPTTTIALDGLLFTRLAGGAPLSITTQSPIAVTRPSGGGSSTISTT